MKLVSILLETLKPDPARAGHCYALSAKECMVNGGIYTIARINSNGKKFLHAYVDRGEKIWDPEYNTEFSKSEYIASLAPKVVKTLDKTQVSIFILKNKSFPYPEKLGIT
jgi:hypothetical protein